MWKGMCGIASMFILSGCASITGTNQQPVLIQARLNEQEMFGIWCDLKNNKGSWSVKTPSVVMVNQSFGDLEIVCKSNHLAFEPMMVPSHVEPIYFGNLIFGGMIGFMIDGVRGAGFRYPSPIIVDLKTA